MESISDWEKKTENYLLCCGGKGTISVQASVILNISNVKAAKLLYVGQKLAFTYKARFICSNTSWITYYWNCFGRSWIIADRLYSPCYIGGWSAAEYWSLTEQTFRRLSLWQPKPRNRTPNIKGTPFSLITISDKTLFGLKPVWKGQIKLSISDPSALYSICLIILN